MKLALPKRNIIHIITEIAEHDETDAYVCLSKDISNDDRILYNTTEICSNTDKYVAKLVEVIKSRDVETIGLGFDLVFPTADYDYLKTSGFYDKLNYRFKENNCIERDYKLFIEQVRRVCAGDINRLRQIDLPIVYGLLRVRLKGFEPEKPKMHIGDPQLQNRKFQETQYLSQSTPSKKNRESQNEKALEEYYRQKSLVNKMDGVIVKANEFFEKLNAALKEENLALMIGDEQITYENYVLYTLAGICDESDVEFKQVKKDKQKRIQVTNMSPLQRAAQ